MKPAHACQPFLFSSCLLTMKKDQTSTCEIIVSSQLEVSSKTQFKRNSSELVPFKIKSLFLFFFAAFSFTCLMCTCGPHSHVWISSVALSGSVSLHAPPPPPPPPVNQSNYTLAVPWPASHWGCMYFVHQSHESNTRTSHHAVSTVGRIHIRAAGVSSGTRRGIWSTRRWHFNSDWTHSKPGSSSGLQAAALRLFGSAQELSSSNWCTSFPMLPELVAGSPK